MLNWCTSLQPEDQVKVVALLGAAIAFLIGLLQYRKAQRWKRSEWLATEMQALFADPVVKAALQMIDWGARRIELYPDREKREDRFIRVTDDDVANALQPHDQRTGGFTQDEAAIRDIFDHFLDRVERIHSFVAARLVTTADVRPYLGYWAYHIMHAREGDPNVDRLVQLRTYRRRYGYVGVGWLLPKLTRRLLPGWKRLAG